MVDVIREYIQLKPAGINFRANCPFHNEKSPSFMVSSEKQIWHCFGCGKGGDIFSFVMEMEGLSFIDALRLLAPKAGVELKAQNPELSSKRGRLIEVMEQASKYYHHVLMETKLGTKGKQYLLERGLTERTIEDWQIGYSPDNWEDLINFLKSRKYKEDEIFSAGLSIKKEGTNRYYNRFRDRIMFPIRDVNANVVAFTARVNPEKEATEKMGKYINSPQTMIYDKGKLLFGLDRAKTRIRAEELAIVVEGQMDVITAHQHGFNNVIASSGTALTAEQIGLIARYTKNIALALDSDSAGQKATDAGNRVMKRVEDVSRIVEGEDRYGNIKKFINPSKELSINIKIIEIPSGKDPDECIKKSPEEWKGAVEGAKDIMQYFYDKAFADADLENIENRRKIVADLLPKVAVIGSKDKTEQDFWVRKISQKINVSENALREELGKVRPEAEQPSAVAANNFLKSVAVRSREEMLSEMVLAVALKFPDHLTYLINNLSLDHLIGHGIRGLYNNLVIYYNKSIDNWTQDSQNESGEPGQPQTINYKDFRKWLIDQQIASEALNGDANIVNNQKPKEINQPELLDRLALLADKDFFDYTSEQAKNEIVKIVVLLKKTYLLKQLREVERLIGQTEKQENNEIRLNSLLEDFKLLSDEYKELNKIDQ